MGKIILLILLFLIMPFSKTIAQKGEIFIDTIQIIQFVSTNSIGKTKIEILGYEQYFIFNSALYNNPAETDLNICKDQNIPNLKKVSGNIKKSTFYKKLMSAKNIKQFSWPEFTKAYSYLTGIDSIFANNQQDAALKILVQKKIVCFYTFTCDQINEDLLAGGGVHSKYLEKVLYKFWKGKFLLPLHYN